MIKIFRAIMRRLIWGITYLLPIKKNRIVMTSYYGRGYGDNLKYIANELMKVDEDLDIIWLVKNKTEGQLIPEAIKQIQFYSMKSLFYLATAGIWIDNCRKTFFIKKRKQLYIQTWHGGGAQKKCERDVENKLPPSYVRMALNDSKNIDIMISESRFMTDLYHHSFWYEGAVYECGYPRYGILLKNDNELIDKVKTYFGIDSDKELVLYAPTFRADNSFEAYNIDFERLCRNLHRRFNKDYIILVHLHPNIANMEGGILYDGKRVINSTFYPDMQELIAASSILIGDYSSVNYDFSLKKLPVFRYVADLEKYCNDRDFYFPFAEYPYPYAQNNDEFENIILDFDEEDYLKTLDAFFERIGAVMKNDSAQNVADLIMDYIHCKNKNEFFAKNKERFIYGRKHCEICND